MNFIGGIEGMNFTPISGYNNFLKNNMSFDVNEGMDFENVLNTRKAFIDQNSTKITGGVEMNMNFDNLMVQKTNSTGEIETAGDLMNSFSKSLGNGLESMNQKNLAAEQAQEDFALGKDVSVHDVMIASQKASLSMQMAIQLRNKMVAAYTEISNVRV